MNIFAVLPVLSALGWACLGVVFFSEARAGEPPNTEWHPSEALSDLPSSPGWPQIFDFGIESMDRWAERREEIKAMIQHYEYGRIPPRPDIVTAKIDKSQPHSSGLGREEWLTLSIGSEKKLEMRMVVYTPEGTPRSNGKYPVIHPRRRAPWRHEADPHVPEEGLYVHRVCPA